MTDIVWTDLNDKEPPTDGRLYLVVCPGDRGIMWWWKEKQQWGWLAEGDILNPGNVTHWAEMPTRKESAQ